jgi:hypothetical protein
MDVVIVIGLGLITKVVNVEHAEIVLLTEMRFVIWFVAQILDVVIQGLAFYLRLSAQAHKIINFLKWI